MVPFRVIDQRSDTNLFKEFRDLFQPTLDHVATTSVSRATWPRIESGEERQHSPSVQQGLQRLRYLMRLVGRMPYTEVRPWATRRLRGVFSRTSRDLARTVLGLNYLLRHCGSGKSSQ